MRSRAVDCHDATEPIAELHDLRVRVSRGQLRVAQHAQRCAGAGEGSKTLRPVTHVPSSRGVMVSLAARALSGDISMRVERLARLSRVVRLPARAGPEVWAQSATTAGDRRRRERRHRCRAARRHRRSGQSRAHRKGPDGRHRRRGPVQDRRPAAGHLHGDVHAARLQHGQTRRHRADDGVHGDGERRHEGGLARGDDHGRQRREPGRRHSERAHAERALARGPGCAPDAPSRSRRSAALTVGVSCRPAPGDSGQDVGGNKGEQRAGLVHPRQQRSTMGASCTTACGST